MAKLPMPAEVAERLFGRVYVCKRCHHKQRIDPKAIRKGKAVCRKCGYREFRPRRTGKGR